MKITNQALASSEEPQSIASARNRRALKLLLLAASERRTIYYGELAKELGIIARGPAELRPLFKLLQEVCSEEHRYGRPMLGAVVVARATGIPGKGFFRIAAELGLYAGGDEKAFHAAELEKVFAEAAAARG